jgi:hypothetical protein
VRSMLLLLVALGTWMSPLSAWSQSQAEQAPEVMEKTVVLAQGAETTVRVAHVESVEVEEASAQKVQARPSEPGLIRVTAINEGEATLRVLRKEERPLLIRVKVQR